jgi:hypothetical protein
VNELGVFFVDDEQGKINGTFGFEDLANSGDKDYNDLIVQVNLSVNIA